MSSASLLFYLSALVLSIHLQSIEGTFQDEQIFMNPVPVAFGQNERQATGNRLERETVLSV
jgi:hypothetical protein